MVASKLTVYAYQQLLDRGWRRSGTYLYLTYPDQNCCPAYTIRLHAASFQPSAAQKKALRRFDQFLSGEWAAKQQKRTAQRQQQACVSATAVEDDRGTVHVPRQIAQVQRPLAPGSIVPMQLKKPHQHSIFGENVQDAAATRSHASPAAATSNHMTEASALLSAAALFAKRCNSSFFAAARHLAAEAPAAVQNVLECPDDVMFTVKGTSLDSVAAKPAEVATSSGDCKEGRAYLVHLQSSVCWKAAAKYNVARSSIPEVQLDAFKPAVADAMQMVGATVTNASSLGSSAGDTFVPQMSKRKAKKARRIASKHAATDRAPTAAMVHAAEKKEKSVSCIAEELAEATHPTLEHALQNDALLSAVKPVATCTRGHMHVTLRVPSVSELDHVGGVAEEVRRILKAAGCFSNTAQQSDEDADAQEEPGLTSPMAKSALEDAHAQRAGRLLI
jgi:hypothetical protein